LAVRKQAAQKSDGGRFNLRKLNDLEVRKQYRIEITNRFTALENISEDEDMNRARGETTKINYGVDTGGRRKRGRPRKTWMEGVHAAMKTRHLEADQWLNRKEWCLGSGGR
jgi:hypothetical protein